MSKYITVLVWAAALLTTTAAQEPIKGHVVDATRGEAPPSDPVEVHYREHGITDGSVSTHTGGDGEFTLDLPGGWGKSGLLYVREPEYNSAVLRWPPVDRKVVLRLTKPIPIYGRLVNTSGLAVSGARLKWRMAYDGRLTSGTAAADQDGSFYVLIPGKPVESEALRLAAWADLHAPTKVEFSYTDHEKPDTVLRTLEDVRGDRVGIQIPRDLEDDYIQDWIDEILSQHDRIDEILSQEPATEPSPR